LLKYGTVIDLLNNLASIKALRVPTESYLKLLTDPNLVIDSENSVFQFLWMSVWGDLSSLQEKSALYKINFDCFSKHFLDTVVRNCLGNGRGATQFLFDRLFSSMTKKNEIIPRIVMKRFEYKRELKINVATSQEYGYMCGQGYRFSFFWKNPNIEIYCSAGGSNWLHNCTNDDEHFNLTIGLELWIDRNDDLPQYVILQSIIFDSKHHCHVVNLVKTDNALTGMEQLKIPMIDDCITIGHRITFSKDYTQSENETPLTLPLSQ